MARSLPPPFTLTEAAKAHLASALDKEPGNLGVRVSVKTAGCSGLKYQFFIAHEQTPDDISAQINGLPFLIDRKAELYLLGATLDLVISGPNKALDFVNNANEAARCGCGESFVPKAQG